MNTLLNQFQEICRGDQKGQHLHEIEVRNLFHKIQDSQDNGQISIEELKVKLCQYLETKFRHREKNPDDFDHIDGLANRKNSVRLSKLVNQLKDQFTRILIKRFKDKFSNIQEVVKEAYSEAVAILLVDYLDFRPVAKIRVSDVWLIGLNSDLKGFVIGIGQNKLREELRHHAKTVRIMEAYKKMKEIGFELEKEIFIKYLPEAIDQLSNENHRYILKFYFFEGYSHKEIAALLGLKNAGSSKVLLTRAKAQVEQYLEDVVGKVDIEEFMYSKDALYAFFIENGEPKNSN